MEITVEKNYYFKDAERSLDYADFNYNFWSAGNYAMHTHMDYYEIIIATSETFINKVNSVNIPLSRMEVLIIPPGISHSVKSIGTSKAPHHNLAIKRNCFESFIRAKKHLASALMGTEPYLIPLDEATFTVLSGLLCSINNDIFDEKFLLIVETALHIIACASLIKSEAEGYSENTVTAYCKDAINKIDSYAFISYSVSDIYRNYPVSHSTLCKEFKRLTDKTPHDYLAEKKMEYAKNLVLTTSLSMTEIAELIGFESGSHFIRKFSKVYGISPLKYRKGTAIPKSPQEQNL